jgi:hypothetical protein
VNITIGEDRLQRPAYLTLALTASATTVVRGSNAVVTVHATGGKKPYDYAWTGPCKPHGSWCKVTAATPGEHVIAVDVSDARNQRVSTNITITVTDAKGKAPTSVPAVKSPHLRDSDPPAPPNTGRPPDTGKPPDMGKQGDAGGQPVAEKPEQPVERPTPPPKSLNEGPAPVLRVEAKTVAPGGKIVVTIAHPPREKMAWIGFYKVGAGNRDYIAYSFLNNLDRNTYEDVLAPDEPGKYNFRIFRDESYEPVGISEPVTVK